MEAFHETSANLKAPSLNVPAPDDLDDTLSSVDQDHAHPFSRKQLFAVKKCHTPTRYIPHVNLVPRLRAVESRECLTIFQSSTGAKWMAREAASVLRTRGKRLASFNAALP
jgi:hypothetical protein